MTDDQFLYHLAHCSLPPAQFGHLGHVRLGFLCLRRFPAGEAIGQACGMIERYAAHHGAAGKFHRTVSEALMRMLLAEGARAPGLDWPAFAERAAPLVADAKAQLARHYSPALLASDAARLRFAEPDLLPLPC